MSKIEEKRKYVHVRVRPPRGYIRYRYKDVGAPGGMKAVVGVRPGKGPRGGRTEVQKFVLERKDVGVRRGRLYAKTSRGKREIRSLGGTRAKLRRGLAGELMGRY